MNERRDGNKKVKEKKKTNKIHNKFFFSPFFQMDQ